MKNLASLPRNITAPSESSPSSFSYEVLLSHSKTLSEIAAYYPSICSDELLTGFNVESILGRLFKGDNVDAAVTVLLYRNMLERHLQFGKQYTVWFTFLLPHGRAHMSS